MATRSRYSTRKTGQKERQIGSLELSQRAKTSQNRKTTHPKDSVVSKITKDRERESGDKTAICVTVRCRSRNKQEKDEDHAVILRTDGIKGKTLEMSTASSPNRIYNFDRVFSSAADQRMVYEDTVYPMVNELLLGYNCTIFAYGQTGTGKTYTMFGDMAEDFGLMPDNAGIIPRTLHTLFDKIKGTDSTVKCSFIELYNESLRDLLSDEDDTKLQLFENEKNATNGSLSVKGMQESYINSASAGIELLQLASQKRQVAATKCNDFSSRSHTIFTINVLIRSGEESITSGKLNLVDLAGSENIQRSGAENKRAIEAGQINKSLLTLGRVINALVDKSSHIPYRESKLTRLLQDSLGGHTRTCIIATVSPCQSSQDETASTLDYAFRAKNIHNRPQINTPIPKNALLSELGSEIEVLKRNLRATRNRNGVYLTSETYEEMTKEIESRRIINEEQRQRIEALESGFQHKAEELFAVTRQLRSLESDNKKAHSQLSQMNDALHTAQHTWDRSVAEVSDITEEVVTRMKNFQAQQTRLLQDFSNNLSRFFDNNTREMQRNQTLLYDALHIVENAGGRSKTQLLKSETEEAFHELKEISKSVRMAVSRVFIELSQAITRMSEGLQGELVKWNSQFNMAYSKFDSDLLYVFQIIVKHIEEQNVKVGKLQRQLRDANSRLAEMNQKTSHNVARLLEEERTNAEADRQQFLMQIGAIYDSTSRCRWDRLQGNYSTICNDISTSGEAIKGLTLHSHIDEFLRKQKQLAEELTGLRTSLRAHIVQDKEALEKQHFVVQETAESSQKALQQSFDNHKVSLDQHLEHWAHNLEKTQSQNNQLSDAYLGHLETLETTIQQSVSEVKDRLRTELESSRQCHRDMTLHSGTIEKPVATLEKDFYEPLLHLRASIQSSLLPISASVEQVSNYTTASPRSDNGASFTSLVHKSKEPDTSGRPEATPRSQRNRQVEQPYLEAIPDDSDQPPLKRRRL